MRNARPGLDARHARPVQRLQALAAGGQHLAYSRHRLHIQPPCGLSFRSGRAASTGIACFNTA